jgi:hypothetical protein
MCVYTKRIHVMLLLHNMSLANFTDDVRASLIHSVAEAAGVPDGSVTLISATTHANARRHMGLEPVMRIERGSVATSPHQWIVDEEGGVGLEFAIAGVSVLAKMPHVGGGRRHSVHWHHAHSLRVLPKHFY